jgi:hypothetical protein
MADRKPLVRYGAIEGALARGLLRPVTTTPGDMTASGLDLCKSPVSDTCLARSTQQGSTFADQHTARKVGPKGRCGDLRNG